MSIYFNHCKKKADTYGFLAADDRSIAFEATM